MFTWLPECLVSLKHLKQKLCSAPALAYHEHAFVLCCGRLLPQLQAGLEASPSGMHVPSPALNQAENKFTITVLEILMVVWTVTLLDFL